MPSIQSEKFHLQQPLITIGITTYDRQDLLRDCVASILNQTYRNIEVIIGNDYVSTPVTWESLRMTVDPRVRIVNHSSNIGAYNNNYFLLSVATGDWFTWLADDDLMHPVFLEAAVDTIRNHDVKSVFTNYAAGTESRGIFPDDAPCLDKQIYTADEFIDAYAVRRIRTIGSYGLLRRDILANIAAVPRFGSGRPVYVDTFIPILAASLGNLAYIDAKLVFLRTHMGSGSIQEQSIEAYASAQADFLIAFQKLRLSVSSPSRYRTQVENFARWFGRDGWAVICRRHHPIRRRVVEFFSYSWTTLLAPLHPWQKIKLLSFFLFLSGLESLREFCSRLIKRI